MRFRLRTLMIFLALGPPVLAGAYFKYRDYKERQELAAEIELVFSGLLRGGSAITLRPGSFLDDLSAPPVDDDCP
jgi:hypothetical protein